MEQVRLVELLGIGQVAVALGVTRRTVLNMCRAGKLPVTKHGHKAKIARSAVERYLGRQLTEGEVALLKAAAAAKYRIENGTHAKAA